jgi:collagen type III alpha
MMVDEDGSGTLEHCELKAALKAAHVPCNDATISEMIQLMDANQDGVISWEEFRRHMANEMARGKSLLAGEYLLPSGTSLNFGIMLGKLRRDKLMTEVLDVSGGFDSSSITDSSTHACYSS